MIQVQLKLKLRPAQERMLVRWLWHLTAVYNWASKSIEHEAALGLYPSFYSLKARVNGHSTRLGIPLSVLRGTVHTAHDAWKRCFRRLARRPRLKGKRNRLNSIPFPCNVGAINGDRIGLAGLKAVKFYKMAIPDGRISSARIIKRASGWYLCLFIHGTPKPINSAGDGEVGIDPGFSSLMTLSTGEKVEHPRELARTADRLSQAQRGRRVWLTARLKEREANQRKDRNHKLSRRLVSENALIAWSKDCHQAISKRFGKSVASAAHGQLRQMLAYKCRSGGRQFIEVSNRYSTVTCSACGARSGPTGYAGLKVRQWRCGCGADHDRDVNAAVNTLFAGRGLRLERVGNDPSGIARRSNAAMVNRVTVTDVSSSLPPKGTA